jgi:hypothetical protein
MKKNDAFVKPVVAALTDDLRKPKYRGNPNPMAGHCYVASEALFHLLGGQASGWVPHNIKHENDQHWYLKHRTTGAILDPTASQFRTPVPYEHGRGKGFLTKLPSKRAQEVIDRVKGKVAEKTGKAILEPAKQMNFADADPWTDVKYARGGEKEFADWEAPMPGPDEHPDLHGLAKVVNMFSHVADSDPVGADVRAKWKQLRGKTSVVIGLRAHKNSPHNPMAVFLKYAIHRVENPELYENKTEQEIRRIDGAWLEHHQQGKAADKNGQMTVDDLHATLAANPNYLKALLSNQAKLHKALKYHAGKRLVDVNGEPHLPLVRGYSVEAHQLDMDHSVASYADNPHTSSSFGGNLFHWLIPLKKIWHSYDLGPKAATSLNFGNEDEYLVSPHSRIKADPDTVSPHVPRNRHDYSVVSPQSAYKALGKIQKEYDRVNATATPDNNTQTWPEPKPEEVQALVEGVLNVHPEQALDLFKKYPYPIVHMLRQGSFPDKSLRTAQMANAVHEWQEKSTENKVAGGRALLHILTQIENPEDLNPKMFTEAKTADAAYTRLGAVDAFHKIKFTPEEIQKISSIAGDNVGRLAKFLGKFPAAPLSVRANSASLGNTDIKLEPSEVPEFMQEVHRHYQTGSVHDNAIDVYNNLMEESTNVFTPHHNPHVTDALMDWSETQGRDPLANISSAGHWNYVRSLSTLGPKWANKAFATFSDSGSPYDKDYRMAFLANPHLTDENFDLALNAAKEKAAKTAGYSVKNTSRLPWHRIKAIGDTGKIAIESWRSHWYHPKARDEGFEDLVAAAHAGEEGAHYQLAEIALSKGRLPNSKKAHEEIQKIALKNPKGRLAPELDPSTLKQLLRHPSLSFNEKKLAARFLYDKEFDGGKNEFDADDEQYLLGELKVSGAKFANTLGTHGILNNIPRTPGVLAALPDIVATHFNPYVNDNDPNPYLPVYKPEHALPMANVLIQSHKHYIQNTPNPDPHILDAHNNNIAGIWNGPHGGHELKKVVSDHVKTLFPDAKTVPLPLQMAHKYQPPITAPVVRTAGDTFRDFLAQKHGLKRPGQSAPPDTSPDTTDPLKKGQPAGQPAPYEPNDLEDGLQYHADTTGRRPKVQFTGIKHIAPNVFIDDPAHIGNDAAGWLKVHPEQNWLSELKYAYDRDFDHTLAAHKSGSMPPAIQIDGQMADGRGRAQFHQFHQFHHALGLPTMPVATFSSRPLKKGIAGAVAGMALTQVSPQLKAAFDKVNPPAHVQKLAAAPKPDESQSKFETAVNQAPKWTPEGLHSYLVPVAHLESSWGKNMNHLPHSKGEYHTAYGPVGLKPSTAHEEWTKTKKLKETYPGLEDPATFMAKFKSDWNFHNLVASSHFLRLVHRHGSAEKAAYAWRWGSTAASGATEEQINKNSYVMRYRDLAASTGVKKSEPEDLIKMAIKDIKVGQRTSEPLIYKNFNQGNTTTPTYPDIYEYSHVLPKRVRKDYRLFVGADTKSKKVLARIFHNRDLERFAGTHVFPHAIGAVFANRVGKLAEIDTAEVKDGHEGQGLGTAAYEALYAHMYHHHGVRRIGGDTHSSLAALAHQKLANKHDLDYPNRNEKIVAGRPFDDEYGPYDYELK